MTRRKTWTVGTLCTVLGLAGGALATSVRATFAARAEAREFVTEIAEGIAEPIRRDLDAHVSRADAAMAPGGVMHGKFDELARRVDWLVRERACRIDPRSPCPAVAEILVSP